MKRKKCEIICVGTELLLGDILNTNAQFLAQGLSRLGLDVYVQTVVGDNASRLSQTVQDAMHRADILLFTGGLGPTQDDLTKEVVAGCFGKELYLDKALLADIQQFYATSRRAMPKSNEKQALMPKGGQVIPNHQGTAPGCIMESAKGHIAILMPGPPREVIPMFEHTVAPFLQQFSSGGLYSRLVKVISLGESRMAEMVQDLLENGKNPTLAPYAKDGEAMIRLTAKADSQQQANELIAPVIAEIQTRLGRHVYGVDVPNIETAVAELLIQQGLRLSFLEVGSAGQAAYRLQTTDKANEVCGPCLSAPTAPSLEDLLGVPHSGFQDAEAACQHLARLAQQCTTSQAVLAIVISQQQYACCATIGSQTRSYVQQLPKRSADYYRNQAVQASFDLVRLMLLDRVEESV